MKNRISKLAVICVMVLAFVQCSVIRADKVKQNNPVCDKIWMEYVDAANNKRIDFLLNHSLDTIHCCDCLTDSHKTKDQNYEAKMIFQNHLDQLVPLVVIENKEYSISNIKDGFIVSYNIKCKKAKAEVMISIMSLLRAVKNTC